MSPRRCLNPMSGGTATGIYTSEAGCSRPPSRPFSASTTPRINDTANTSTFVANKNGQQPFVSGSPRLLSYPKMHLVRRQRCYVLSIRVTGNVSSGLVLRDDMFCRGFGTSSD
ncbi:hypothetical protein B0H65DRAFT_478449 [Neurospora tetraspora]|uniref:Uncharacterized protein n=1 Tax=Neurospora tetraspora TaxID=94610 RepID=A0AAE0J7E5_9PEZI|nr:hypothetical protein B0H65DRAFT_478449 [Neurospora tetraspora]